MSTGVHNKHVPRAQIKIAGGMVSDRDLGPTDCSFPIGSDPESCRAVTRDLSTVAASFVAENLLPQLPNLLQTPLDRSDIDVQLVGDFLVREAFDLEGGDSLSGLIGQ